MFFLLKLIDYKDNNYIKNSKNQKKVIKYFFLLIKQFFLYNKK